ncbi:helix-turn-helix domain-containing protein [Mucilaginibacter pedocola]|uniref:AraC family transcriptional regulator n=1 Tax=Mucilaginibacter pedocola TaxID=1792845 RepID=A0A1S9PER5_9SPHI|nr:AraC family transcriptional regulator [Mucilaginibacter pedocola]OOQ59432.1 AraC family transcriptional regulator [Mucilaginibacter pedocola]
MTLYIKNMVCSRCILVVRHHLEQLGFRVDDIKLGSANISPAPGAQAIAAISSVFEPLGFELLNDRKEKLVQEIKSLVIEKVRALKPDDATVFSEYLATNLGREYSYLSRLFSEAEGTTIEKFIILHKVERVKELLEYGELNINEIAYQMGYSSGAHLSAQFKNVTGITPRQYKTSGEWGRVAIDTI